VIMPSATHNEPETDTRNPRVISSDNGVTVVEDEVHTRAADIRPGSADRAAGTIEVIASTGARVRRMGWSSDYEEELVVNEKVFDLKRFVTVGPVLDQHNHFASVRSILGIVEAAWFEDRKLIARLKFDMADPEAEAVFSKMERGFVRAVSLGYDAEYERIRAKDREDGGTVDLMRSTRVEPYEISAVLMPADAGAIVRSAPERRRYTIRDAVRSDGIAQPDPVEVRTGELAVLAPAPAEAVPASVETAPAPQSPEAEVAAGSQRTAGAEPQTTSGGEPAEEIRMSDKTAPVAPEEIQKLQRETVTTTLRRVSETRVTLRSLSLDEADAETLVQTYESDTELRSALLERLAKRAAEAKPVAPAIPVPGISAGEDQADKVLRAMEVAIQYRAVQDADPIKVRAFEAKTGKQFAPKLDDTTAKLARSRLIDLASIYLEQRGVRTQSLSHGQIAELALTMRSGGGMHTTGDFPNILANTANKLLAIGYAESQSPWRNFARRRDRPDFKEFKIVRRSGAPRLTPVNEAGEIKRGKYIEGGTFTGQLGTAGVTVGFTRQMLVNDDLDAFSQQSLGLGDSAVAYEDDLLLSILTDTGNLNDGYPLFDASRGNISADAGAPDLNAIIAAAKCFASMTETVGKSDTNAGTTTRKNAFTLVGFWGAITEMLQIDQVIGVQRYPDGPSNAVPRTLQGLPTYRDDRLQIEATSPDHCYAVSNRPVFAYGGLEGDPNPRLSMNYEASVDGAVWQLIHDVYVAVEDPQAIVRIPKS